MNRQIAIIGNGQLAHMMHDEAEHLGLDTTDFPLPEIDKDGTCKDNEIKYWVHKLKGFDCVTFEIENIPVRLLKEVENFVPVYPSIDALSVSQDRLNEKQLFKQLGIKTNEFLSIESFSDLCLAADQLGFPFILKTRRFGYDGKGQYLISSPDDLKVAWSEMASEYLIAEKFVKFDYEVSQIATRDQNGKIVFYPLVRNEHRKGILRETFVLEDKNTQIAEKAKLASKKFLEHFNYVGTMAIELFVVGDEIYANETAPRVHNSGHWTINGCETSQFNNHLRAISGQSLGQVNKTAENILMINLIGEDANQNMFQNSAIHVKSYGKEVRANRKIGHINVTANDKNSFISAVDEVYSKLNAEPCLNFKA